MGRSRAFPATLSAILLAGLVGACAGGPPGERPEPPEARVPSVLLDAPDDRGRAWAEETLRSLSLEERVGQLVFPWLSGAYVSSSSEAFDSAAALVDGVGVGGFVISIGTPLAYAAKLNRLQRRARVPLLVASDFENGGPGMRIAHVYALPSLLGQGGGTSFPPTMAFGAIGDEGMVYEYARITAVEARAVGVHLNFAPVLDVNSNPDNPVINTRSFGESPEAVARLGAAYIRGAHAGGVLTTAKHFPGHGDTRTDSHLELPVVTADMARLDTVELVPFRRAVEAGVDAVMTAHVVVPEVEGPAAPPATLSPRFMTGLLREDMGFRGLLFTDALRMQAITEGYGGGEAAILALEAGADVLLAPDDPRETVRAVVAAVRAGRITPARIDSSVRRVLEAKARVGLDRGRTVALDRVDEVVASKAHLAFADSAASRSITLVRDRDRLVPADLPAGSSVLSVSYARPGDLLAGRAFDEGLGEAAPGPTVESVRVEPGADSAELARLAARAESFDRVLVGTYVPPVSGSGSVAVDSAFAAWVERVQARRPTMVVSFGSPYVLEAFPHVGTYMLAWGDREVSQRAAVRALLGREPVTGRLPISIPPYHRRGEGLRRGVADAAAGGSNGAAADHEANGVVDPGLPFRGPVASSLEAEPAELGVSPVALRAVDSVILRAIADSASPGAALAVGYRGRLLRLRGYGRLDWGPDAPPATPASLWDLASLTKVVGTTTAAMILVDRGRLDLDAPVVRYLPWWAGGRPGKERVLVRHLLLHRAGLPGFRAFYTDVRGREGYMRALAELPLEYRPGERTLYSDLGIMTLGFVVEAASGVPLDEFLDEEVWSRLGMADTGFRPPPSELPRIAATEVDTIFRHEHVHGEVHDENAWAMGGVAGHAGLFSSARDLAVFAQMMLNEGLAPPCRPEPGTGVPCDRPRPDTVRLIRSSTVERFTARWDSTSSRALGWDTPSEESSSVPLMSARAFGHTGFTGTSIWIDPGLDLFVVLLTSRVNPSRENHRHLALRRSVHDLVVEAVGGGSPRAGGPEGR